MKLKRIAAAFLAAVTLALTAAVTVSADSLFDTAKNIDSGKKVTKTLNYSNNDTMEYKFTASDKGTASVKVTAKAKRFAFNVYDEDGNEILYSSKISMQGSSVLVYKNEYLWDSNTECFKGTFSWDVKANKTYYIKINKGTLSSDGGKFEVSFKYPTGEKAPEALMSLTLKKGDTVQLGANGDSASWTTSQKSVATVSDSGLVTAVKKGKAVITLKCGSKSQKIEIIVN